MYPGILAPDYLGAGRGFRSRREGTPCQVVARCPKPGHSGHYSIHQGKPAPPPRAGEQAPASARKTPHNDAQGDHGTVRPAQCPKTMCELGRVAASFPFQNVRPHTHFVSTGSYFSTLQSNNHPREKVQVVEIKIKIKTQSKPGDGTDDSKMYGLKKPSW